MSELKKSLRMALAYLQDNAKAVLAVLNAVVIVALLYVVASHAIFELRIRGLVKTALALQPKAVQADGGSNASRGERDSRDSQRGRRGDRSHERRDSASDPDSRPAGTDDSPDERREGMGTPTSGDAEAGSGTLAADTLTSASEASSPSIASDPDGGSSGTLSPVATSGTMTSSGTAVVTLDEPPSPAEVSTQTVAATRQAIGRVASAWTSIKKTLGSGSGKQTSGSPTPPDRSDGRSDNRKPDDPKEELIKKMHQRALFGGPKPTVHNPVFMAVLGDQALIDNNWVGVGEKAGAYEVVSISATTAVLKDPEGNEMTLSLGTGGGGESSPGGPPRPGGPAGSSGASESPGSPDAPSAMDGSRSLRGGFDPSRIPTSVLERLTGPDGPFAGMTPDQIRGMDPDEIRERLRSRRDGTRGGRGGSRGSFRRD